MCHWHTSLLPFLLCLPHVSSTFLACSRSLQASYRQAAKGRCNGKAWDLEPWQAGLLCSPPAAALSEQVAELSLLDRLLCVLSELFLPSGSLKEYASDDPVQANLTLTFHFSQFKSLTFCCSQSQQPMSSFTVMQICSSITMCIALPQGLIHTYPELHWIIKGFT